MRKSLGLFSCAVLGAAILAPTVVGNDHAQADSYYGRGYYNNYSYNPWYNNYYPNYNYGYNYNYNYGYNNYNPGYNNYNESGTYRYSNGYLYYILSDGSYYVNYNGRWVRGGDYNNNSGSNNTPTTGYEVLRNDPHYRYENGTHYYLKDNGDYYYYSNGKWVLVKASSTDSEAPTTSTVDSTSSASSEVASTVDSTSEAASTGNSSSSVTSESSSTATSETGSTSKTSSEAPGLEKPPYAPETNIDYDKLPKSTLPPTDYRMYLDPLFVDDNGTCYYRVALTDEDNARGIDGHYKWVYGKWKIYNGTANDDPELDPDFYKPAGNDEYMYDDNASSVKLYSKNVVGTGKAGEALSFQNS